MYVCTKNTEKLTLLCMDMKVNVTMCMYMNMHMDLSLYIIVNNEINMAMDVKKKHENKHGQEQNS
jgi:hypothetical protein